MDTIFKILGLGALAGFVSIAVGGFLESSMITRIWFVIGAILTAMVAAARGMILLIAFFWMFPVGLHSGLMNLFGFGKSHPEMPFTWIHVLIWAVYLLLGASYVALQNQHLSRIAWGLLILLLAMNIGGCQEMSSAIMKVR